MNNTQVNGWVHIAEAAVQGLHGLLSAPDSDQRADRDRQGAEVETDVDSVHDLGCLGSVRSIGRAGFDHVFQGDGAPCEITHGEHVFRRHAVFGDLANAAIRHTQTDCERFVASALFVKPWFKFHDSTLEQPKAEVKSFLKVISYDLLKMDPLTLHRKNRLRALIAAQPFGGNQLSLANAVGLTDSRISQMVKEDDGPAYTFGERAGIRLARKLRLDDRYFEQGFSDSANSQSTVELSEPLNSSGLEGDPGLLLLRLVDILSPLSPWLQESAVKLITKTLAAPDQATVNAVTFANLLKLEMPPVKSAKESHDYALNILQKKDVMDSGLSPTKQRKEK